MNDMTQPGRHAGAWLVGAVLGVALFVYPLTLDTPLLDPDEGFHAAIAQEMVDRGDWLVPRLFGKPFWDKPAFYFWFEAASLQWFGMTEAAVRLPGLLFGLLGVLSTGLVGARLWGRRVGYLAAGLYATMFLPLALCQAATPDVALVVWVNLALLLLWESEWATARRAIPLVVGAGVCMGLAMLTKGLFGVALIVVAQGGYLVCSRRLTAWSLLRGFVAVVLGTAVAALWYLPMERANPGYLHYFFIERHFLGLLSDTQTHGQRSLWYYLPVLLIGGMPWIGYLPALARDAWSQRAAHRRTDSPPTEQQGRRPNVFLLSWLIGCTLLLSVAGSKLITYLWPVFPAVAILAAETWRRWLDGELSADAHRAMFNTLRLSCLSGPVLFPLVMLVAQHEFEATLPASAWLATLLTGLVPLAVLAVAWAGSLRYVLAAALLATAVQFVLLMTFVIPHIATTVSCRELAEHFNRCGEVPARVRLVDERVASLVFYLEPSLRRELQFDQIARLRARHVPYEPPGTVLVLPEDAIAHARRKFDLHRLEYELAGRHRVYEPFVRQPSPGGLAVD